MTAAIERATREAFGEDLRTANFLDAGAAPLAAPNVQAAKQSPAQLAAAEAARQRRLEQQQQTLTANYRSARAQQDLKDRQIHAQLLATSPEYAAREARLREARTDWGLLPAAAKIAAIGVGIAATGGALAGALALPSAGSLAGLAVAADRLVAASERAGVAPKGASTITSAGAAAAGAASSAQGVIDRTRELAAAGVPAAVQGAEALARATAQRAAAGATVGVPQALTARGAAALDAFTSSAPAPVVAALASSAPPATPAPSSVAASSTPPARRVDWFVSAAGKVTRGAVSVGKGWRVYGDGKVVQQ